MSRHVDNCPACGAKLLTEIMVKSERRVEVNGEVTEDERQFEWTVRCADGHIWGVRGKTNVAPKWILE